MKYVLFSFLLITLFSPIAIAAEHPPGQIGVDASKVLRGSFVEEKNMPGVNGPLRTSGAFVISPANGLIWAMQQPMPTATVITPTGAVQDFGGLTMKLHAKNIHHIYDMVGSAVAGDWSGLEQDFTVTRGGNASHWLMTLTPRDDAQLKTPYRMVMIAGSSFIEKITLISADGSTDIFTFTNEVLSSLPLQAQEAAFFGKASQ